MNRDGPETVQEVEACCKHNDRKGWKIYKLVVQIAEKILQGNAGWRVTYTPAAGSKSGSVAFVVTESGVNAGA